MTQEPLENARFGQEQSLAEAIPSHGANTAANGVTHQVIAAPTLSQDSVDASPELEASSSTNTSNTCACIVCLGIGTTDCSSHGPLHCTFAGCDWVIERYGRVAQQHMQRNHVRDHYCRQVSPLVWKFVCPIEPCRYKSKRWPDLQRHTTAKHCKDLDKLACSVIGCKYHGEGNGFTRKDKFIAHYKSMHQGQKVPGKAVRAIRPAPASSHGEASGSSSMGAQGE